MIRKILKSALIIAFLTGITVFHAPKAHAEYYSTECMIWQGDCVVAANQDEANAENNRIKAEKEAQGEEIITTGIFTPEQILSEIGGTGENGLNPYTVGQHPDSPPDFEQPGVGAISSPLYYTIDLFRLIMSGVAIIMVMYMAIRLVTTANADEYKKVKLGLIMSIFGFILIQVADVAVKDMFFGEYGEAFGDLTAAKDYATESTAQIRGIIGIIHIFLASIAVFIIIIRGFFLLSGMGNEDEIGKTKSQIIYAVIGIMVVGLSEIIVRGFIFPDNGASLPNINTGKNIAIMITNYVSGFIAVFAFATLFYGGYKYVISGGNDEAKDLVKKIILSATIALFLSLGAFAIVNTIIQFDTQDTTIQTQ